MPPAPSPLPVLPAPVRHAAEAAKGFMPPAEGQALFETAAVYAAAGPVAEIGTYCGKSTLYLAAAAAVTGTGPAGDAEEAAARPDVEPVGAN